MSAVDEALKGPDFFYCDFLGGRMRKAVCIRRQTIGIQIDSSTYSIPDYCRDCEQGKKNIETVNGKKKEDNMPKVTATEVRTKIESLLREGKGIREVMSLTKGVSKSTVRRIFSSMPDQDALTCACGLPLVHRGRCSARRESAPSQRRKPGVRKSRRTKKIKSEMLPAASKVEGSLIPVRASTRYMAIAVLEVNEQEIEKLQAFNEAIKKYLA